MGVLSSPTEAQSSTDSTAVIDAGVDAFFEHLVRFEGVPRPFSLLGTPESFCFEDSAARLDFVVRQDPGVSRTLSDRHRTHLLDQFEARGFAKTEGCDLVDTDRSDRALATPDGDPAFMLRATGVYFKTPDQAFFSVEYFSAGRAGLAVNCAYLRSEDGWELDSDACAIAQR